MLKNETLLLMSSFILLSALSCSNGSTPNNRPSESVPAGLKNEDLSGFIFSWKLPSSYLLGFGPTDEQWLNQMCQYTATGGTISEFEFRNLPHLRLHRISPRPENLVLAIRDYTRETSLDSGDFEMITVFINREGLDVGDAVVIPDDATLAYTVASLAFSGSYEIGCAKEGVVSFVAVDKEQLRVHVTAQVVASDTVWVGVKEVTIDQDFELRRAGEDDLQLWRDWVKALRSR